MTPDMLKLINSMQEGQAGLYSRNSDQLNQILKGYDPVESALYFSSLLLDPAYQSTTATLEKAIHLCLGICIGKNKTSKTFIKKVFKAVSSDGFSMMEDPAEDVMASRVWLNGKEYKVLLGLWEGCIHQTQMFINVLESMPRHGEYLVLYDQIESMLIASDKVLSSFNAPINTIGSEYPQSELHSRSLKDFKMISENLDVTHVHNQANLPVLLSNKYQTLPTAVLGKSELEAFPFIESKGKFFLALPTAITTSIRRLIYSFCNESGHIEKLTKGLAVSLSRKFSQTRIFGEFKHAPVRFEKRNNLENWLVARLSIEFDTGYYYQFIFVMDSLIDFDKDWFQGFLSSDDDLARFINLEINNLNSHLSEKGTDSKSCTIIVPCGFGRGFSIGYNPENKEALTEVINANDLITLSQDKDCNPYKIWRLVEAQNLAKKHKAHISNLNGFLNLYGYVKQNDFSIFNHSDFVDVDSDSIFITVGTNFQKDVREATLQDNDIRVILHPELGSVLAQRGYPNSLFEQNDVRQIYCPFNLKPELLQAAYLDCNTVIWIEMPVTSAEDISVLAQIFNAYVHWLPKVVECLHKNSIDVTLIELICLDLDISTSKTRALPPKVTNENVLNSCSYTLDDKTLECYFDENLFHGFNLPTNVAEQALLKPLISKLCMGDERETAEVMSHVFNSPYARHFHIFECQTYSEDIVESFETEKPITLDIAADKNHKFGLAWINGDKPETSTIIGKPDCKTFLAKVVSNVWLRVQEKLRTLNKEVLVQLLMRNVELCQLHKTRWSKSFRANQHLQNNHENLYQVATTEIGLLNGASLASRLIIEMAICECPDKGGKTPGKMDIQQLQSHALSLHILGGVSEAINFDAIKPKLVISHFGDVMFEHDFEDLIVSKYQLDLHKEKFDNSAKNYERDFSKNTTKSSEQDVENAFEEEFWKAWIEEFGFSPNQGIDFINAVQKIGYSKNELIFTLNGKELRSLATDLNENIIDKIIDCLSLKSRKKWTDIPAPFKSSDWQPWRFKRRYSSAYKPIIFLSEIDTYIISPEHIQRAFFHLLRNAHDATIDESHFQSKMMISWNGSQRAKTGLLFNTQVANIFDKHNWHTEEEVKLTKILNKKLKDFGDIDVLAWHKTKNIVLAIECKDLEMAMNQSEIARQLYEFKGNINQKGKSDRLRKHILRVDELKSDILGLSKYVQKRDSELQVIGMVVFSSIVPMHFVNNFANDIVFSDIDKLPDYLKFL
jgi:hypothetical protein